MQIHRILCLVAAAAFAVPRTVAGSPNPPSIQADGGDLLFTWGDGQTMSMTDIANGIENCATKADLSKATLLATGNVDLTNTANQATTIPLGKMSVAEVARLTFTITGYASPSRQRGSFKPSILARPSLAHAYLLLPRLAIFNTTVCRVRTQRYSSNIFYLFFNS